MSSISSVVNRSTATSRRSASARSNAWSMSEFGHQAVVWQTAVHPVVARETVATGETTGAGAHGPEAFPAQPFLDSLAEYGSPHGILEL